MAVVVAPTPVRFRSAKEYKPVRRKRADSTTASAKLAFNSSAMAKFACQIPNCPMTTAVVTAPAMNSPVIGMKSQTMKNFIPLANLRCTQKHMESERAAVMVASIPADMRRSIGILGLSQVAPTELRPPEDEE